MLNTNRVRQSRRAARATYDEQGSLVVALVIIMVIAALIAVFAATVIDNQMITVNRQNTSSALAAADAGLSDALFRVDQFGNGNGTQFCVAPSSHPCSVATTVPGIAGSTSVEYVATPVSATQWTIQSVGTTSNASTAVQETLTRSPQYSFALFANTELDINGSQATFGTYTPGGTVNPDGSMAIGSNNSLDCNGGIGNSNVTTVIFTQGNISGCASPTTIAQRYNPPSFPTTEPTGAQTLPNGGVIGSTNGYPDLGSPGATTVYWATSPVSIAGNLTMQGPVQLYIMLDPSVYNSNTVDLSISAGSYVNFPPAGTPLPDPTTFEVFSNATGQFGGNTGLGYTLSGIIDAPGAQLTANGCKSVYYGALIINTMYCNGSSSGFTVYYDSGLSQQYGAWVTSGYTQINPASVNIP
jgi:Tfp pilus assembly protein PilX